MIYSIFSPKSCKKNNYVSYAHIEIYLSVLYTHSLNIRYIRHTCYTLEVSMFMS